MLILASASPRRRELLTQAGFSFQVESIPVAEDPRPNEDPIHLVKRLAREKAQAVFSAATQRHATEDSLLVLGADTVVVCDDEILGKPVDHADAARMLRLFAGRTHQVVTGVCLISSLGPQPNVEVAAETTRVTMLTLSEEEILAYIATGEPMDKAGAYAIQGHASRWIPRIVGCYFNVVGLPIALVNTMIESAHRKLAPHSVS
jgi:septum formation protein